jgi:hypothetical protein
MAPDTTTAQVEDVLKNVFPVAADLAMDWREVVGRWGADSGAARGLLEDLVRMLWDDETLHVRYQSSWAEEGRDWVMRTPRGDCTCGAGHVRGADELEVLVGGLEAAARFGPYAEPTG